MDENYRKFADDIIDTIAKSTRPGKKEAGYALLSLWKNLHAQGVSAFDFAHASVNMAETVMAYFDSLEENIIFGEYLKEAGSSKIRAVRDHWPPIDAVDWPTGTPPDVLK